MSAVNREILAGVVVLLLWGLAFWLLFALASTA